MTRAARKRTSPAHLPQLSAMQFLWLGISVPLVFACSSGSSSTEVPDATAPQSDAGPAASAPEPDGVRYYYNVIDGADVLPAHPAPEGPLTKAWHYRVERTGGRVSRYEKVNPAGKVAEVVVIQRPKEGVREVLATNAYGAPVYTDLIDSLGRQVRSLRSGEVLLDGCYQKQRSYDAHGRVSVEKCLDDKGQVIADASGCFVRTYTWSPEHDLEHKACLQDDMTPLSDADGVHRVVYQYDSRGALVEEAYYGPTGERTARLDDGCARTRYARDAAGNAIDTTCLNVSGLPQSVHGSTYVTLRRAFDPNGCKVGESYLDENNIAARRGQVSRSTYRVDHNCGIQFEEHRDIVGNLALPAPNKPARVDSELNPEGLPAQVRCFGPKGDVACFFPHLEGPEGAMQKITYDSQGRIVAQRCYRPNAQPSRCAPSYPHETRREYGSDGRQSATTFLDEKGGPALGLGVARMEFHYNAVGKETVVNYLDQSGKPLASPAVGFATRRSTYDQKMLLLSIELRGINGDLSPTTGLVNKGIEWPSGAARVRVERGAQGDVKNFFYKPDGTLVRQVDCSSLATPCYRR